MTTEQRESIVNRVGRILDERIALVRWHRQKACEAHGLPFEDNSELRIVVEQPPAAAGAPASATAVASVPATTAPAASGVPGWVKAAAVGAMGLGGLGAAAGIYNAFTQGSTTTTVIEQPAEQTGSLLQSLEDRGFHLPNGNK